MRSIILILCLALSISSIAQDKVVQKEAVVLELFTSEGCSSCPPFEKLAEKLTETYGNQIIILSQHVDYWDYLGWEDKFAAPMYTARQSKYRSHFDARYLVTPQFIGNGEEILKGNYIQSWIENQLGKTKMSTLDFQVELCESQQVCINYKINTNISNKELCVALIENDIFSDVKAGENRGKQYNHQNVVRYFKHISLDNVKGIYSYTLPDGVNTKNCRVAVFLQDKESLSISDATVKKLL